MNIEFHYYITAWLAKRGGFTSDAAALIGASSQFVDQSTVSYSVTTPKGKTRIDATQDYSFWDESVRDSIYLPFHFVPSFAPEKCTPRIDGKKNRWSVVPDSEPARELFVKALKTRNLYRIGIAAHAYADTWAHQNFSGLNEEWNTMDDRFPLPPAGHLHALRLPDTLSQIWTDPRLDPEWSLVTNRTRFMNASRKICKYFRTFNKLPFDDIDSVIHDLGDLLGKPGEIHRDERTLNLAIDGGFKPYDRTEWLREAGIRDGFAANDRFVDGYDRLLWLKTGMTRALGFGKNHSVTAGPEFFSSSLCRWNEAANEHREAARGTFWNNA